MPDKDILRYIKERKETLYEELKVDKELDIDPYDDVARLREVERIEKFMKKIEHLKV